MLARSLPVLLTCLLIVQPASSAGFFDWVKDSFGKVREKVVDTYDEWFGTDDWSCGSETKFGSRVTAKLAVGGCMNDFKGELATYCNPSAEEVNGLCEVHDACYDEHLGKVDCDEPFCDALTDISEEMSLSSCRLVPFVMCYAVQIAGDEAYERAGNKKTQGTRRTGFKRLRLITLDFSGYSLQ